MAWIEGTEEQTFVVDAPYEDVVEFFCEPARFQEAFADMEESEQLEPDTWKWTLEEKSEKGITFQAVYTVKYTREGDSLTWETLEGNMRSEGSTTFEDLDGQTRVTHRETIATDLPIPKLAATVFKPIVAREIRKGVGQFLDRAREILESR